MANDHNPETGPIEDESSVTQQCLEIAIHQLHQVIIQATHKQTLNEPIWCSEKALKEVMANLQDAYEALDTKPLPTGNEDKQWVDSGFLVNLPSLNCGHAPTHAYMQTWMDGSRDMVAECHRCNYSAVVNEAYDNYNGNDMNTDTHPDFDDCEGERQAEAEAERQADAQAELRAEACYGDDFDGGWY
jgi:hypothetical protein